MKKPKLNTEAVAANQVWEHIATTMRVQIISIKGNYAYCVVLPPLPDPLCVKIPVVKFSNLGNRGFCYIDNDPAKIKVSKKAMYGEFNSRRIYLGAE